MTNKNCSKKITINGQKYKYADITVYTVDQKTGTLRRIRHRNELPTKNSTVWYASRTEISTLPTSPADLMTLGFKTGVTGTISALLTNTSTSSRSNSGVSATDYLPLGTSSYPALKPLVEQTSTAVADALTKILPQFADSNMLVRPSEHADLQSNIALSLAKKAGMSSKDLANSLAQNLVASDLFDDVTVSGPGFINFTLSDKAVWEQVANRSKDSYLGVEKTYTGKRVVLDYSAPNVAKQMHVGHLRTTVIGDSLGRVLESLGADVIRQNHVGDWGTQFGMLIQYLEEHPEQQWTAEELGSAQAAISAADKIYKTARTQFDADPEFATRSRERVVKLQTGDEHTVEMWQSLVAESESAFADVYSRLGTLLGPQDLDAESSYNEVLPGVAETLEESGVVVESDGALIFRSERHKGPTGEPAVLVVKKADGGYGYAATDLAAIRHRVEELKADRLMYVVDARQSLHFDLVFEAARKAGWLPDTVSAEHIAFGSVLGADGRPFKTRSGDTVPLADLLDDAVAKAANVISEKQPDADPVAVVQLAEQAGIGAVTYADLSNNRIKDYVFDSDRMVALNGNTAVYLQYAHTRMRSILRKVEDTTITKRGVSVGVEMHPAERALAMAVDAHADVLIEMADTAEPHRLCTQVYELSRRFTEFYDACPVKDAPDEVRGNRVALVRLAADTLAQGLNILGIAAPDRM